MIRAGQEAGEFGDADADEVALLLASLLDGLAVQATLDDPDVGRERMLRCALEMAESLLDCELGAAAQETAAGDGPGAAKNADRDPCPTSRTPNSGGNLNDAPPEGTADSLNRRNFLLKSAGAAAAFSAAGPLLAACGNTTNVAQSAPALAANSSGWEACRSRGPTGA